MACIGERAQGSGSCRGWGGGVHLMGQQGPCSHTPWERREESFPKERGVGSMGPGQNRLPRSITLTEVDKMQNQGMITQCKVMKPNNGRTKNNCRKTMKAWDNEGRQERHTHGAISRFPL